MDEISKKELKKSINDFDMIIEKIEKAPTYHEKMKIIKNFNSLPGFDIEDKLLDGKKIGEHERFQEIKHNLYPFLDWLKGEGVNVFEILSKDVFFMKVRSSRLLDVGILIDSLKDFDSNIQPYMLLNIYRTLYELNLKALCIFAKEYDTVKNRKILNKYLLGQIKERFSSCDSFEYVLNYFTNDLRNPTTHEEWLVEDSKLYMKIDEKIKEVDFAIISEQIRNLFFLTCALQSYLNKEFDNFAKDKETDPLKIDMILNELKKQRELLRSKFLKE